MVEATIRMVDGNVPVTTVWASRGKAARAEPVSALYEQGRVHHIGTFSKLEDQMCAFTSDFDRARAGYSPDRLDALVWGLTELLVGADAAVGHFRVHAPVRRGDPGPDPITAAARVRDRLRRMATPARAGQGRAMITSSRAQCKIPER